MSHARPLLGKWLFTLTLPVALCGSYLRDAFACWEESGTVLYIFAGVYLFTAFVLHTKELP